MDSLDEANNLKSLSSGDEMGLIENEVFDFDLPVSPLESPATSPLIDLAEKGEGDDEDEVFMGPMGFKEQCVATNAEIALAEQKPMSPPSAEQYAHIFKEAMSVALELEQKSLRSGSSSSSGHSQSCRDFPSSAGNGRGGPRLSAGLDSVKEDFSLIAISKHAPQATQVGEEVATKSEVDRFKRQVKRDMGSPLRRKTYTVAANQPSPYPKVDSHEKKEEMPTSEKKTTALGKSQHSKPALRAPQVNGRGSRLPMRAVPVRRPSSVGKTHVPEGCSQMSGVSHSNGNGLRKPATKRLASPKVVRVKRPSYNRENATAETKTQKAALKSSDKSLSLIKPSAEGRPAQRTVAGPNKPQPMKATLALSTVSKTQGGGGALKRTMPPSPTPGKRRESTQCTPVCQDKNAMPKRLLSSGSRVPATQTKGIATPRRSVGIPRPSTPSQSHTRNSGITVPGSAGLPSGRRRSAIPIPNKQGSPVPMPTSRLSSVTPRRHSAQLSKRESSALVLTPLQTPLQVQLSPEAVHGLASPPDAFTLSGSSPDLDATSTNTSVPTNVLRLRTNFLETGKETTPKATTPKIEMLIDFGSATPKNRKTSRIPQQLGQENLIDL